MAGPGYKLMHAPSKWIAECPMNRDCKERLGEGGLVLEYPGAQWGLVIISVLRKRPQSKIWLVSLAHLYRESFGYFYTIITTIFIIASHLFIHQSCL
jgi:hypothetical protein